MINNIGLEEVGIDGGGVFREFLSELIKTSFDPNRGFFMFVILDFFFVFCEMVFFNLSSGLTMII